MKFLQLTSPNQPFTWVYDPEGNAEENQDPDSLWENSTDTYLTPDQAKELRDFLSCYLDSVTSKSTQS